MGFGFSLPSFRPPSPPAFMPPAVAKIVTAPMAAMTAVASKVQSIAPKGGIVGKLNTITVDAAKNTQAQSEKSVNAALAGDLNTAFRSGLQAVAEPSKASNRATLEVYTAIPGPIRSIISTIVGTIFPVTALVFMALDLQVAANNRVIASKRADIAKREAAGAQMDLAEIQRINAEISALESDNAKMEADKLTQENASKIDPLAKPTFKESITYSWMNAINIAKGK